MKSHSESRVFLSQGLKNFRGMFKKKKEGWFTGGETLYLSGNEFKDNDLDGETDGLKKCVLIHETRKLMMEVYNQVWVTVGAELEFWCLKDKNSNLIVKEVILYSQFI